MILEHYQTKKIYINSIAKASLLDLITKTIFSDMQVIFQVIVQEVF